MSLCLPSLIYLVISLIGLLGSISYHTIAMPTIIVSLLFIIIWTWLLNYICYIGYEGISWIILFFPIILALLIVFIHYEMKVFRPQPKPKYTNVTNGYIRAPIHRRG
jgi:hypothetical protein